MNKSATQHTPSTGSPTKRSRRSSAGGRSPALFVAVLVLGGVAWHLFLRSPPQPATSTATSIYALKDSDLSKKLIETGKEHPYTKCKSQQIRGRHLPEYLPAAETFSKLKTYPKKEGAIAGNEFVEVLVKDAPCWGMENCCEMNSFFRPSVKADISIFKEVFQEHDLSTLYAVFRNYTPKYVLDAGPGSGARTQMLKKIFPSSVLVALEPDPARFENLMLNTREVDGVHAVHGALWYRHAVLRLRELGGVQLVEPTGDSGKLGGDNVLGFGIVDFYRMFDIPQFDFVYLDLEGAEAMVFARGADLSWLNAVKVVAMKVHPKLGKFFGTDNLVSVVSEAIAGRDFTVVVGKEDHVILISRDIAAQLRAELMIAEPQQPELGEEGEHRRRSRQVLRR